MAQQRVRWRLGDNEIEIEGTDAFISNQLKAFFEKVSAGPKLSSLPSNLPSQIATAARTTVAGQAPSPSEYLRQKTPQGGTETLVVLAKFLTDFRGAEEFSVLEINKLAKEARLKDVHNQYFTMAVQQGLLRTGGKGKYAITLSGEDAVAGMPRRPKNQA